MEHQEPKESALIVPVLAASPLVDDWRSELDPSARWGVPPHVTIVYPFVAPETVTPDVIAELTRLFRSVDPFNIEFSTVKWFGEDVVWLAPEPDDPLRALINLVAERWPEFPPYGGAYPNLAPHLTIGAGAPLGQLEAAAADVEAGLPLHVTIEEAVLMAGSSRPSSWTALYTFPLGR